MPRQRRAAVAILDPQYLLRLFVEEVVDYAVILLDTSGTILSWNIGARRIKGYDGPEIVGRHFSCFYTAKDQAADRPGLALRTAQSAGKFEDFGLRVRKDGSQFFAHVVITPVRDERGTLLGFGKITQDISRDIELEDQVKSSELRAQNLADTVLDTIVDGVITINHRGEIQSYNDACIRLFGYERAEIVGKNVRTLMPEPYRGEHDSYIRNYRETGVAKIIGIGREVSGQRKNGSIFPMDLSVGATNAGGDHAFVGVVRDTTERHDLEKARELLRQTQKMDALGQLTAGIAHDFNNLLGIIVANLDLLRDDIPSAASTKLADEILDAALRGAELTQRLLAFGRKQALQPSVVSMNDLLEAFVALANRVLGERIKIVVRPAADLWPARVDKSQFEDMLLNLTLNARDAMPAGGKLIYETANVTLDEAYAEANAEVMPGGYVMVAVTDTGTGMPPEVVERAFEPFFTTKGQGKGNGLGLSMAYGFVKQSQGHIKIYSENGSGTSIKVYLPRSHTEATAERIANDVIPFKPALLTSQFVLVVEDNPSALKATAAMLVSLGYQVLTAADADEALAALKAESNIGLLMSDVMLPGKLNGPDLAVKAAEIHPHIKILFNSGYAEQSIVERGLLQKGAQLISKPFRRQQLAEKLSEIFNG